MTEVIGVSVWGRSVGAVAVDPTTGYGAFEYEPAWLRRGIELAPLQMPLSGPGTFIFPGLPRETYKGVPAMLSDALPDSFGNALIDSWLASKGMSIADITVLDRLAYMGQRAMGALEFKPAKGPKKRSAPIQMKELVEAARKVIEGDLSSDREAMAALAALIQVGTSAGGARAKAVIAWNPETGAMKSGQFEVDPGYEHWLLKFDGVDEDNALGASQPAGRVEYAYYLMAQACGIEMMPCRLLEENGRAHFMTKRFDRDGNDKHHVQTLCAMAHFDFKQLRTYSYEQVFQVADQLGLGEAAKDQIFRRMVFNVLGWNCDDHTKNWSFRLKDGGSWELSPAYDLTFSYKPTSKWISSHFLSVNEGVATFVSYTGLTKNKT